MQPSLLSAGVALNQRGNFIQSGPIPRQVSPQGWTRRPRRRPNAPQTGYPRHSLRLRASINSSRRATNSRNISFRLTSDSVAVTSRHSCLILSHSCSSSTACSPLGHEVNDKAVKLLQQCQEPPRVNTFADEAEFSPDVLKPLYVPLQPTIPPASVRFLLDMNIFAARKSSPAPAVAARTSDRYQPGRRSGPPATRNSRRSRTICPPALTVVHPAAPPRPGAPAQASVARAPGPSQATSALEKAPMHLQVCLHRLIQKQDRAEALPPSSSPRSPSQQAARALPARTDSPPPTSWAPGRTR